jgi:hypothetical protein
MRDLLGTFYDLPDDWTPPPPLHTYPPENCADFDSRSVFRSEQGQGEWICWDFHDKRVIPTHYGIISGPSLKSWILEGSLDGGKWTLMDRKVLQEDFCPPTPVWFAVLNPVECRFIRLTQTAQGYQTPGIVLGALDFFGTLLQ